MSELNAFQFAVEGQSKNKHNNTEINAICSISIALISNKTLRSQIPRTSHFKCHHLRPLKTAYKSCKCSHIHSKHAAYFRILPRIILAVYVVLSTNHHVFCWNKQTVPLAEPGKLHKEVLSPEEKQRTWMFWKIYKFLHVHIWYQFFSTENSFLSTWKSLFVIFYVHNFS